jgi:translation elongation factor EF-Ts
MSEKLMQTNPVVDELSRDTGASKQDCRDALERCDWSYFSAKCWLIENLKGQHES